MIQVLIPEKELYDEIREEFIVIKSTILQLEHSLLSISKWESKWCKPFLLKDEKTSEETIDYIKCMILNKNISNEVFYHIPKHVLDDISDYINSPMTATWFSELSSDKKSGEIVTSEIIYYWMIAQNIPMECEKWHLNRLLTLIRVCNIKNKPPRKMGKKDMISQRKALNDARRKQYNTKG